MNATTAPMIELGVAGVGLSAPGLPDWTGSQAVLRGERPWAAEALPPWNSALLPPNERRRATPAVRQAFRAAEDAVQHCGLAAAELPSVFSSSEADLGIIDRISLALAEPARLVSPTDFHNSVHNAAAGYWSIAAAAHGASTSIAAYDGSVAAGLLEAAGLVLCDHTPVLLVCYDVPPPALLADQRPISAPFSAALVLCAPRAGLPRLRIAHEPAADTSLADAGLEALRLGNPSARMLPLLVALARGETAPFELEQASGAMLSVQVLPASA